VEVSESPETVPINMPTGFTGTLGGGGALTW
jgi:hypothetical protein